MEQKRTIAPIDQMGKELGQATWLAVKAAKDRFRGKTDEEVLNTLVAAIEAIRHRPKAQEQKALIFWARIEILRRMYEGR